VRIFHHCAPDYRKKTNAALLMSAFLIISYGFTPEKAWEPFKEVELVEYWDAGEQPSLDFRLSVLDCLKGL